MSIYSTILSNIKAAVPELNNSSQTDPLIKIASSIAPTIDNTIAEFTNTKNEILDIIGNQRYLKTGYYLEKALAYQDGDNLIENTKTFENYYLVINTTKQIIKQAALIRELSGDGNFEKLSMKVAKLDSETGKLAKLDTNELNGFKSYFLNFTAPGLWVNIFSLDPNIFNFNATLTYFSSYNLTLLKNEVSQQLQNFRDTFTFNGVLFVNDLETYLKNNVPGVRNVSLSGATIDGFAFTDNTVLSAAYFDYFANIENNFTYVAI